MCCILLETPLVVGSINRDTAIIEIFIVNTNHNLYFQKVDIFMSSPSGIYPEIEHMNHVFTYLFQSD